MLVAQSATKAAVKAVAATGARVYAECLGVGPELTVFSEPC